MTNGKSVKGRTMISKTLHRKHRRRISQISGVNSGAPKGLAVPAPLVISAV
jgi:hypothetical protein